MDLESIDYNNLPPIEGEKEGIATLLKELENQELFYEGTVRSDLQRAFSEIFPQNCDNSSGENLYEYFSVIADYQLGKIIQSDDDEVQMSYYRKFSKTQDVLDEIEKTMIQPRSVQIRNLIKQRKEKRKSSGA